jgi:hypothetical protein
MQTLAQHGFCERFHTQYCSKNLFAEGAWRASASYCRQRIADA